MSRILDRLSGLFSRQQSSRLDASKQRKSPLTPRKSATLLGSMPNSPTSSPIAVASPDSEHHTQKTDSDQASNLPSIIADHGTPTPPANTTTADFTKKIDSQQEPTDPELVTRQSSVRDLFHSRKRHRQDVQARSYDQVISLIERIGTHLDTQAERSDRMVTLLERLPDAINALPEIQRNGEQLTAAIETHFDKQHHRDLQLQATIEELGVGAARQAEALNLIHQEVHAGHQREAEMTTVMADFRQTLSNLDQTNEQSVDVLKNLVIRSKDSESKFTSILSRQNRTLIIVATAAVVSSLAGLTIALIALIKITTT